MLLSFNVIAIFCDSFYCNTSTNMKVKKITKIGPHLPKLLQKNKNCTFFTDHRCIMVFRCVAMEPATIKTWWADRTTSRGYVVTAAELERLQLQSERDMQHPDAHIAILCSLSLQNCKCKCSTTQQPIVRHVSDAHNDLEWPVLLG